MKQSTLACIWKTCQTRHVVTRKYKRPRTQYHECWSPALAWAIAEWISRIGPQEAPPLAENADIKQCRTAEPSLTSQSAGNDPKAPADRQHRQQDCRGISADSRRQSNDQTMPNMSVPRSTWGGQDADWPT